MPVGERFFVLSIVCVWTRKVFRKLLANHDNNVCPAVLLPVNKEEETSLVHGSGCLPSFVHSPTFFVTDPGTATLVVGCQSGKEGKGKLVDFLSLPKFQHRMIAQFAGQGIRPEGIPVHNDTKVYCIHPSVLHNDMIGIYGSGMFVDLIQLEKECWLTLFDSSSSPSPPSSLTGRNSHEKNEDESICSLLAFYDYLQNSKLKISLHAQLVFSFHSNYEQFAIMKSKKLNVTVEDLLFLPPDCFAEKVLVLFETLCSMNYSVHESCSADEFMKELELYIHPSPRFSSFLSFLKNVMVEDLPSYWEKQMKLCGDRLLIEAESSTGKDIDFGNPRDEVLPISTSVGGAISSLGLDFRRLQNVIGVFDVDPSNHKNTHPSQFVLDITAVRHSIQVNSISGLAMMKLDLLTGYKKLVVCLGETPNRNQFISLPGWSETIHYCREMSELPANGRAFVLAVERYLEVPILFVSVGPKREQMIQRFP